MLGTSRPLPLNGILTLAVMLLSVLGCSSSQSTARSANASPQRPANTPSGPAPVIDTAPSNAVPYPVMLGIDVFQARGFDAALGKRVGLLTHPPGVNRHGTSTIDTLRRAKGVNLVALFGPEHGIYGDVKAAVDIEDSIDHRTGLPVYSLHGKYRKPTKEMLKGLDAMIIDLQDIGTRSYTFVSCMLYTMGACFENGVEVIVLDRPNPLGGLKVDGPPLDPQWKSYVGAFRAPYVHGLTIGEIARMAKQAPGVLQVPKALDVSEADRLRGKLTVIPMRGWSRSMRWPETGLKWVPTSQYIQDFGSVVGYPMSGLGTYLGKFSHGIGKHYAFRGISHPKIRSAALARILNARKMPGMNFRVVEVPGKNGKKATGLYAEVIDYNAWRPTELNFHLMQLACRYDGKNPFSAADSKQERGFLIHMGSTEFFEALKRDGAGVDVAGFIRKWESKSRIYQQQSRKYWLYQ